MDDPAPRELTPPPLQAPTAKEKKYDRQLRLWAAAGQRALEESHVLLVIGEAVDGSNTSVAGAETLKNLILPSIGRFTIADSATVTEADLGVNFFLEPSSLGKSRAEEMRTFLQELNPDVEGYAISEQLSQWLPREESLRPYNLIIACAPVASDVLERLCTYASDNSIPLVHVLSQGFYGTFSVQLPSEFPVVDTHPEPDTIQDLRLLSPWPELEAARKELGDITKYDDHDHGHIPWLLLLLYYLEDYKTSHEGKYPSSFKEKTEFRTMVGAQARTSNAEGGEENFDEACAAVLKSISPPTVSSAVRDMFAMPSCTSPSATSSNFWITANAIQQFYNKYHVLPLSGSIPDMKATSEGYIRLQTIYKTKARQDVAEVTHTVRQLESKLGRTSSPSAPIAAAEIEQFCKNAAFVKVLTNPKGRMIPELRLAHHHPKTLAKIPALLTAYDTISPIFLAMNHALFTPAQIETWGALIDDITGDPLSENLSKAFEEVKRCQGAEMHNTSSVLGGMVAQEAIKLLTRQYVPVDGTVVWDGIRARTEVIKL